MNKNYIKEKGLNFIYNLNDSEHFDNLSTESSLNFRIGGSKMEEAIYDDKFEEDCPKYNAMPHILPAVDRIICIGDIHGDFKLMIDCLELGEVIKRISSVKENEYPEDISNYEWIGNNTVVIQVGDQIDRCRPSVSVKCDDPTATPDDEGSDLLILEFLNELHKLASKDNGAVYSLLGNHEIMNVMGNMNYVSFKGAEQFLKEEEIKDKETKEIYDEGIEIRKDKFKQGSEYAQLLACTRQSVLIIGSNIFVHAAVTKEIAKQFDRENIKDVNVAIRQWLLNKLDENVKVESEKAKKAFDLGQILTNINVSLFWPRILGHLPSDKSELGKNESTQDTCEEHLNPVLEVFQCNNMIVGHTPQFSLSKNQPHGISRACNFSKLDSEGTTKDYGIWRVDIGASTAFNYLQSIEDPDSEGKELMVSKKADILTATVPQVLEINNDTEFNIIKMDNNKYIKKRNFKIVTGR